MRRREDPKVREPFLSRLQKDDPVMIAGGYLFEVERRGYLTAGEFVPKVALEHPEVLEQVTRDFLRAGSDIAVAFTYNGHREKMKLIGEEKLLEPLNRQALRIANKVAKEESLFLGRDIWIAGNISNSNIYSPEDRSSAQKVRKMYREMVLWAREEGVDLILAETMYFLEEARIALEEIKSANLPAIVNMAIFADGKLRDGFSPVEAAEVLIRDGADVVGTNCFQGPNTIRPIISSIRDAVGNFPISAMPGAYRTTDDHPTLFDLPDHGNTSSLPNSSTFPDALEAQVCNRYEAADFGSFAKEIGVKVIGLCCGGSVIHHRALAERLKKPAYLLKYSPNMDTNFMNVADPKLPKIN